MTWPYLVRSVAVLTLTEDCLEILTEGGPAKSWLRLLSSTHPGTGAGAGAV